MVSEEMSVSDFLEEMVSLINRKFDTHSSRIRSLEASVNELKIENNRLRERLSVLEKKVEQKPVDIVKKDILRVLE